jgi:hypothetical protein
MSGLGRSQAVISCALDSSMPIWAARNVGLAARNFSRTCCQVRVAGWAKADMLQPATTIAPVYSRQLRRCLPPPPDIFRFFASEILSLCV